MSLNELTLMVGPNPSLTFIVDWIVVCVLLPQVVAPDVESLHQSTLFQSVLLAPDAAPHGGRGRVHARLPHDLDQLEAEGGDVVLDLVHVVLGHALGLGLPL